MKLLQLNLRNFKGIRELTLDTAGKNLSVYGDNATGKTTLFDAFLWLLFDKDSQNKKDFNIKTLDEMGQVHHGLDHSVEGIFEFHGSKVTLKKIYSENWKKPRGSIEQVFSGHTTDYFIDDVPVQKKEYDAYIDGLIDEKIFRLLTDPAYFNEQLSWQDRRKILLEVCGEIPDEEVIASDEQLKSLPEILGNRTLEDHRKVIAAKRKEINEELDKIPVRIEATSKFVSDLPEKSEAEIQSEWKDLQKKREILEERIAVVKNGGSKSELMIQIQEVNAQIMELDNRDRQARHLVDLKNDELRKSVQAQKNEVADLENDLQRMKNALQVDQDRIDKIQTDLTALREQWNLEDGKEFVIPAESICPTCGQQVKEDMEKLREQFNLNKSTVLQNIDSKGKTLSTEKSRVESSLQASQNLIMEKEKIIEDLKSKIPELIVFPYSEGSITAERLTLHGKKATLEQELQKVDSGQNELVVPLLEEKENLIQSCQELESSLQLFRDKEKADALIQELENQQKTLAAKFEALEKELYLTEIFIKCKVNLYEVKINQRFSKARFKLFETQINGGLNECCETTYNGVPYSSLNNAARINIGLDIIKTLSEYYGFTAPIFIDNREAVTQLEAINAQVISLIVSAADKKLRMESGE